MKLRLKYSALLAAMLALPLLLAGCDDPGAAEREKQNQPITKTVASKFTAIEPRWHFSTSKRMSVSVYYLVAEDGSTCEVSMAAWAKTREGSQYSARWYAEPEGQPP